MQPDRWHPRGLCETDLKYFSKMSVTGEVCEAWRRANFTPIFKNFGKEDLGNHRLASLTLVPEKGVEKIFLEIISKHMKDKNMMGSSQRGFIERKSCLTMLIALATLIFFFGHGHMYM